MKISKLIKIINTIDKTKRVKQDKSRIPWLRELEIFFNVVFPDSYIKYFSEVDYAPVELDLINYNNQYNQKLDLESINRKLRDENKTYPPLPKFLIAISDGHDDNYICINFRDKKNGDYQICNWSVHTPFYKNDLIAKFPSGELEQANFYVIAENFSDFIEKALAPILNVQDS